MTPDPPSTRANKNRNTVIYTTMAAGVIGTAFLLFAPTREDQALKERQAIATEGRPVLGDRSKGQPVVVFLDYACPACAEFEKQMPAIKRELIDTGKMHLIVLHSPFISETSTRAAQAAECVHRESPNRFWAYHQALFTAQGDEKQDWATPELLRRLAGTAGVNLNRYDTCLAKGESTAAVQADLQEHKNVRMLGTPTVFVNGYRTPAGGQDILDALNKHATTATRSTP
ncbi:DsbA family protein [Deinococcus ficus]|nr:DsbA family protein [Deinococcus ficus]